MNCPFCAHKENKVVDSRNSGNAIRRRRECLYCTRRFTTYEYVEIAPLTVIKRDKTREPFQREKLMNGVMVACKKRPIPRIQIENLVTDVENCLIAKESLEIGYDEIGNLVMEKLAQLDSVAYVRFASVYREFKDCGEFVEQIREIQD
jgi:transcriptional repressor NrdR